MMMIAVRIAAAAGGYARVCVRCFHRTGASIQAWLRVTVQKLCLAVRTGEARRAGAGVRSLAGVKAGATVHAGLVIRAVV